MSTAFHKSLRQIIRLVFDSYGNNLQDVSFVFQIRRMPQIAPYARLRFHSWLKSSDMHHITGREGQH